jgi:hypothetical protein
MKEYDIVTNPVLRVFKEIVNARLLDNWSLVGGAFMVNGEWAQTMVRSS